MLNIISAILAFIGGVFLLLIIFIPEYDLNFSQLFFNQENKFFLSGHPLIVFSFKLIPLVTKLFCSVCALGLVYIYLTDLKIKPVLKSPLMYLLLAAILGPGIIVNSFFKENFGRARPSQIREFGGEKNHSKPFVIASECKSNCSFTSGHAGMAFYFTAIAYVVSYPLSIFIYSLGIMFGLLVGLGRIAQGGHFLSDVIFSGLFVLLINHYLYKLYKPKKLCIIKNNYLQ